MKHSLTRRARAGAAALALGAALSACTMAGAAEPPVADAQHAPEAPKAPAADQKIDVDEVLQKNLDAKATAKITAEVTENGKTSTSTITSDNRGSSRALQAELGDPSGRGTLQAVLVDGTLYAKMPGQAKFMAVPAAVMPPLTVPSKDMGTAKLVRTEQVGGEQMAVYAVTLDLSRYTPPTLPTNGKSALPVNLWLDGQQRVRKVESTVPGDSKQAKVAVTVEWDQDVKVAAPPKDQVGSLDGLDLGKILGRGGAGGQPGSGAKGSQTI